MKVAISTYPLKTAHKDRGIGFYTTNLIENLKKDTRFEIEEFIDISKVKNVSLVHYPWFDFFFHTLPMKKKFKTIVTVHDVIPLIFPKQHPVGLRGRFNFILQKIALKSCENIITDSNASKEDLVKYLSVSKEKIKVVHLAANEDFKPQSDTKLLYIKRKYNLPDRFLLYVGDANWIKNLPFLIEGFNTLIKDSDFKDVKLVLIGGVFLKKVENINHPELESLKKVNKLIKDDYLEDKVLRPGDLILEELVSFYNLATMYIQPSLYEGFGLPLIEAFSCGAPVVSSTRGSLMEIGGDAAVYFDPLNLKQFVSILKEVLQNKSLRDKLSKLGIGQARNFSWEKVANDTKEVYFKTIQNERKI